MPIIKNTNDTCWSDIELCKSCNNNCINKDNLGYRLLCYNCTNEGRYAVSTEANNSEYMKALYALCAEI